MNLREFVSVTLTEISHGVLDANDALKGQLSGHQARSYKQNAFELAYGAGNVEFDVALTVKKSADGGSQGSIRVAAGIFGAEARAAGGMGSAEETVSRVKFRMQVGRDVHTRARGEPNPSKDN